MNRFSEKDWKLFRSKIADWQEAYMEKLNGEYIELLSGEGDASEILNEGAITLEDLSDFSEEVQETMKHFYELRDR